MRTYYRGPDAVVTDTSLTVKPPRGPTYALSDLDPAQLRVEKAWDFWDSTSRAFTLFLVVSLAGCMGTTFAMLEKNWWIFLGGVAVAGIILLAGYRPVLARNDTVYVLRGTHRGVQREIYHSPSEAKTFRVWYAVREAMEDTGRAGSGPDRP